MEIERKSARIQKLTLINPIAKWPQASMTSSPNSPGLLLINCHDTLASSTSDCKTTFILPHLPSFALSSVVVEVEVEVEVRAEGMEDVEVTSRAATNVTISHRNAPCRPYTVTRPPAIKGANCGEQVLEVNGQ